ncbi:amino acid adenylation domain-containing protein [Archangium violaceum]|uniref:non-ribosomal peptide synthetase n=1 Tax=Archangium violaceum TaxID=83451 RepID=UPI00194E796E|nr:amino acid adenylation domain-containing protein [Archangium violaceum]QRN98818.1 amino acid adenylation domain-containing protein [Archangium violaceum]
MALESENTRVTYAELLHRATVLGAHLRRLGAGPEHIIGLFIEKSPEYVIALLGVWCAGAAFVPLEPTLPAARLGFMARDCGLRLVLARRGAEPQFEGVEARVVLLEDVPERAPTDEAPGEPPRPDDLAYVIYTSGTTGTPKGVLVPHTGLVNLLRAQIRAFALDETSRAILYLSTSFDASLSDIGTALLSGATLCLPPAHALQPGPGLMSLLAGWRITHADLPPSLLRVFEPEARPPTLRVLVIGGEPCPPERVRLWARHLRVVNVYGPTEATICTSLCACDPETWTRPLLGRPIPNMYWHVLDERGEPVPPGTPGELYLGGVGLARGYVNRPELTAARFIERGGERLYRTGDRVVEDAEGEVEFLGRVDRQLKLRGLRIEPEEVEAHLLRHPGLQDAAVLQRSLGAEGDTARPVLVAYVVPRATGEAPTPETLRAHLAGVLPRWMLPQRFEPLERLPRTVTGKVDFEALSRLPLTARRESRDTVPPTTEREQLLCELWERVLGVEPVGVTDDFFALGGDSLGVLKVVAAAEAHGLPLRPVAMLQHPTIAELLAHLEADDPGPAEDGGMSAEELRADVALGPEWEPLLRAARERPEAPPDEDLLLTGATGFFGARLLHELLRRTGARLRCLVRGRDDQDARERLLRALETRGTPASRDETARLVAIRGDVTRPRWGLGEREWERLTREVGHVYHCAAQVNMVLPYHALREANVGGTEQVLRLLAEGRRKSLHHISTLSVFVSTDRNTGRLEETDELRGPQRVFGGYAQTKWAAEHLLRSARGEAGPITYYRLGLITGDTRTGHASPTDFLSLFFRGVASLGCVPRGAGEGLAVDVTPVDHAAAAVAHLSLHATPPEPSRTFHLANPRPLSLPVLVEALRSFGIPLATVSEEEWRARLAGLSREGGDSAEAAAYLALCRGLSGGAFERHRTMDLFQATGAEFGMEHARAGLTGSGLECPPVTEALLHTYLRYTFGRAESTP